MLFYVFETKRLFKKNKMICDYLKDQILLTEFEFSRYYLPVSLALNTILQYSLV